MMHIARTVPVQTDGSEEDNPLLARYLARASWHHQRALVSLARAHELGAGSNAPGLPREFLLYALEEAVKAYRLLQHVHQEAISRSEAAHVQRRLNKIYTLAESIERALFDPATV